MELLCFGAGANGSTRYSMTRIERHPELPREFGVGPLAVGCSGFCLDRIYVANDGAKTEGCHVRGELHMLEWVGSYRNTSHTTENDAALWVTGISARTRHAWRSLTVNRYSQHS